VDVPTNGLGNQQPVDGQGYAGMALWCNCPVPNNMELFGAHLLQPLMPGVPVYISFKISPTTNGNAESMIWTSSGAGLRFSMFAYEQNGLALLPNAAAIYMETAPLDTTSWYTVSGVYIPDSAYEYVVIGNFFDVSLTAQTLLNPDGNYAAAYVYVDDICVSYQPNECDVQTGLLALAAVQRPYIAPNPFNEECEVNFRTPFSSPVEIELLDPVGHSVQQNVLKAGERSLRINANGLPSGAYILHPKFPVGAFRPVVLFRVSP
jgi:hypothetical protein